METLYILLYSSKNGENEYVVMLENEPNEADIEENKDDDVTLDEIVTAQVTKGSISGFPLNRPMRKG